MTNDVELERKLIPFITGYVRWGGAAYNLPGASNVHMNFNNIGAGIRYHLIFFHIGTGIEHTWLSLNQASSNIAAEGTMIAPLVEFGKTLRLGPISIGGNLAMQWANPKVRFKEGNRFDLGNFKLETTTLFKIECQAGYSF